MSKYTEEIVATFQFSAHIYVHNLYVNCMDKKIDSLAKLKYLQPKTSFITIGSN